MKLLSILILISFSSLIGPILKAEEKRELKILTLNTWLLELPFIKVDIAKHIDYRLKIIPEKLQETGAEIIFLQEVWKPKYRARLISDMAKKGFHACEVDTATYIKMGNGLLIFSMYKFNKPCKVKSFTKHTRTDEIFVKKGVLYGEVTHPTLGKIKLFNTHLGASSFDSKRNQIDSEHIKIRQHQANELKEFIKNETDSKNLIILSGDLNTNKYKRGKLPNKFNFSQVTKVYSMITNELNLNDSYSEVNYSSDKYSIQDGFTFAYTNEYVPKEDAEERIDFIFTSNDKRLSPIKSSVIFKKSIAKINEEKVFISDHFGLMTSFEF